jgi:hypothetical protein
MAGGDAAVTKAMMAALRRRHDPSRWLLADEVALPGGLRGQRMDALAMSYWPSDAHVRHAYEVKASRGDFLREIATPAKREWAISCSERFWFAVAPGVAEVAEIPAEAGLLVLDGEEFEIVRTAPTRVVAPAGVELMLALARRAEAFARREAADQRGFPGEAALLHLLDLALSPWPSPSRFASRLEPFAATLRELGFARTASEVMRRARAGRAHHLAARAAENQLLVQKMVDLHPLPAACKACGQGPMFRTEENPFVAACGGCGGRTDLLTRRTA